MVRGNAKRCIKKFLVIWSLRPVSGSQLRLKKNPLVLDLMRPYGM